MILAQVTCFTQRHQIEKFITNYNILGSSQDNPSNISTYNNFYKYLQKYIKKIQEHFQILNISKHLFIQ